MKNLIIILVVLAAVTLSGGVFWFMRQPKNLPGQEVKPSPVSEESQNLHEATVPPPTEEDVINLFFNLINEKRIDEALAMMSPAEGEDWRPYLEGFEKVNLLEVEKTEFGSFRVLLDVKMKSSSEQEPIPFFGYVDGQNTKFVNLEEENGTWKIKGIATGP